MLMLSTQDLAMDIRETQYRLFQRIRSSGVKTRFYSFSAFCSGATLNEIRLLGKSFDISGAVALFSAEATRPRLLHKSEANSSPRIVDNLKCCWVLTVGLKDPEELRVVGPPLDLLEKQWTLREALQCLFVLTNLACLQVLAR